VTSFVYQITSSSTTLSASNNYFYDLLENAYISTSEGAFFTLIFSENRVEHSMHNSRYGKGAGPLHGPVTWLTCVPAWLVLRHVYGACKVGISLVSTRSPWPR